MAAAENLPTVVSLDQMVADHIADEDRAENTRQAQEDATREHEGAHKIHELELALQDELGPAFYAACAFRYEHRSEDARYKDYPYRAWAITSLDSITYDITSAWLRHDYHGSDYWRILIPYETTFYAAQGCLAEQLITNMASKRRYLRRIEEEQAATRERMAKAKANRKPPTPADIARKVMEGETPASITLSGGYNNAYMLSPARIVWTSERDTWVAIKSETHPQPLMVPRNHVISIDPIPPEPEPTACVFACADCGDGTWAGMPDNDQCPNCGQTSATYIVASGIPVKTEQDPPIGDDEAPF
jgi:hypothetical protein